uniref:uncharacterized protein isoform X1 n=3 Tax=Myxine glutinosa TaxID=7769 RepID=UPI00358E84EA
MEDAQSVTGFGSQLGNVVWKPRQDSLECAHLSDKPIIPARAIRTEGGSWFLVVTMRTNRISITCGFCPYTKKAADDKRHRAIGPTFQIFHVSIIYKVCSRNKTREMHLYYDIQNLRRFRLENHGRIYTSVWKTNNEHRCGRRTHTNRQFGIRAWYSRALYGLALSRASIQYTKKRGKRAWSRHACVMFRRRSPWCASDVHTAFQVQRFRSIRLLKRCYGSTIDDVMSYMLPHLHNGWQVDQAILSEEDRAVLIRFGHDWDPTCMKMDEVLYAIAEKVKNFAVIYLVDITEVPDFNKMYELYDHYTVMFFFRNKHIMIDLGTGNNKINWTLEDKQEMVDIVETVYRGARKGRGLVVSPKDYSTKYRY